MRALCILRMINQPSYILDQRRLGQLDFPHCMKDLYCQQPDSLITKHIALTIDTDFLFQLIVTSIPELFELRLALLLY
jgi:hypothetical protein